MRRGDLVTVALSGDFGKPRPAVIIQSDFFSETESVSLLLLTSEVKDTHLVRITIEPDSGNNLRRTSQVMIDKIVTVRRERVGPVFGRLNVEQMIAVNRLLTLFCGIA